MSAERVDITLCDFCGIRLDESNTCPRCGVYHGEPCLFCAQPGYHLDGCPILDIDDQGYVL